MSPAPRVFVDPDGAVAASEAIASPESRTAVWVGCADDADLDEFIAEMNARAQR